MSYLDRTTGSALLKQVYDKDTIRDLTYRKSPLTALLGKKPKAFGSTWEVPIIHGLPQAVANSYANAQTLAASNYPRISRWAMSPITVYGSGQIDGVLAITTQGNETAFMEALQLGTDKALESVAQRIEGQLFRGGYGMLGTIQTGSSVSGTTLTLTNKGDVHGIEVGMLLSFAASEAGDQIRNTGGSPLYLTVAGRNSSAGTLTMSGYVNSVIGTVAGDYVFDYYFREDSATPSRLTFAGLEAWVPPSAPSSTTFFGINRSTDSRLGGLRVDGTTGASIEELIVDATLLVQGEEGEPDLVCMSPVTFAKLVKQLGSKVIHSNVSPSDAPHIGFKAVTVMGGGSKPTQVVQMARCPDDRIYVLDSSSWAIGYAGDDFVHFIEDDGLLVRAGASSDIWEVRVRSVGNLCCKAPGHNCVIYGPF